MDYSPNRGQREEKKLRAKRTQEDKVAYQESKVVA